MFGKSEAPLKGAILGPETDTLLGTNISLPGALLKISFLFPRWDMLRSSLPGIYFGLLTLDIGMMYCCECSIASGMILMSGQYMSAAVWANKALTRLALRVQENRMCFCCAIAVAL